MALEVGLEALEDRDGVALAHLDHGLLPGPGAARGVAAALGLGRDGGGAHVEDGDVEQALDGLLDLRLVRVRVHPEGVLAGRRQHVRLLGDDRTDEHLAVIHHSAPFSARRARAVRLSSAAWETTTLAAPTRSATPTSSAAMTATPGRLRKDFAATRSSSASATRIAPPR